MRPGRFAAVTLLGILSVMPVGSPGTVSALEEGEITGNIDRTNDRFLRDYQELDYKGQQHWAAWGAGLESLGWIVVRGDSGKMRDLLLLVIDTRTEITAADAARGRFADLRPGDRIRARYRMGWDALHALEVEKLGE